MDGHLRFFPGTVFTLISPEMRRIFALKTRKMKKTWNNANYAHLKHETRLKQHFFPSNEHLLVLFL